MAVRMIQLKSLEEWLEKRTSYVGGSEAAALVGKNPYMSNIDLWQIKTGQQAKPDIDDKEYVIYGRNAEEHLRALSPRPACRLRRRRKNNRRPVLLTPDTGGTDPCRSAGSRWKNLK